MYNLPEVAVKTRPSIDEATIIIETKENLKYTMFSVLFFA